MNNPGAAGTAPRLRAPCRRVVSSVQPDGKSFPAEALQSVGRPRKEHEILQLLGRGVRKAFPRPELRPRVGASG